MFAVLNKFTAVDCVKAKAEASVSYLHIGIDAIVSPEILPTTLGFQRWAIFKLQDCLPYHGCLFSIQLHRKLASAHTFFISFEFFFAPDSTYRKIGNDIDFLFV